MSFDIKNYISNLTYINKDFNSTWEEILEVVPQLTSKWNPNESNESDPLVVLLKELGIVTDKLNYNIDKNTLEAFPDLLTQLRAAYSVFGSMGYVPQWYRSALANVTFLYNGGLGEKSASSIEVSAQQKWVLPKFTSVSNEDNTIQYVTLNSLEFKTGVPAGQQVLAIEGTLNDLAVNGSTKITLDCLDNRNRLYFLQPNVAQNGIFISENNTFNAINIEDQVYDQDSTEYQSKQVWHRVTNLYQQLPGQYVFKFGIDPTTGSTYIQFPDDIGNLIGDGLYIKYILSSGESGNIKAGTLTSFPISLSVSPESSSGSESESSVTSDANLTVSNNASTQNGRDPETIEEMQNNYSRVVGTFNTLVTAYDYENYIYNQVDDVGRPYVSNIRVGDKNTDLYTSYKVKTLGVNGHFSTIRGNDIQTGASLGGALSPYDLRFYPVGDGQAVTDLKSFRETFAAGTDTKKKVLENVVEDAKAILHEYKPLGTPIFLDYDLKGQIYLQKTVSKEEAKEIKANVDLALYKKLEARNLTFGQEINYGEVVDTIKAADPRIQYVALEPITYEVDKESEELYNNNSPYDIYTKSVLAGVTPWTSFEPMRYYWGTTGSTTYGKGDPSSDTTSIKSIQPQVSEIEWDTNASEHQYTVKANETFYILAPGYTTITSYGNYFYMKSEVALVKDTPTKLAENKKIEIFEERPGTNSTASYIIKNAVVRCNVDISEDSDAKYKVDSSINMGSNITLEILGPDEYKLKNTYPSTADKGIKIATNAVHLVDKLKDENNSSYTLNVGEYLLWTNVLADENTPITEVGIVGEGNTLSWTTPLVAGDDSSFTAISADNINTSDYSKYSWLPVKNEALTYRTNTLYSFGEDTVLKFSNEPWGDASYYKDRVFKLNAGVAVQYNTQKDSSDWKTIPAILESDQYQAFVGLSLVLSPNKIQKLEKNQQVILKGLKEDKSSFEAIIGGTNEGTKYIQSNSTLVYAGGQPLTLSTLESDQLTLNALEGADIVSTDVDTFIDNNINAGKDDMEKKFTLPESKRILYASKSSGSITYHIGTGKTNALGDQVGFAYEISEGATYWKNGQSEKLPNTSTNLSTNLSGTSITDYLYNVSYSPVYQPSESDLIEKPLDPVSFFKSSHVCNRFVLPRLRGLDGNQEIDPLKGLMISPLSIRS